MLVAGTRTPLPKRTPWAIQRAVLFALFQRELKARLGGRWLGAFWILLEPLAHSVFMMAVYTYVRHKVVPGMPVPLFLVTGVLPFLIFRNISIRLMSAVDGNRGLFGYRQVKPIDPLIARSALEILLYGAVYVLLLAGMGWYGLQWFPAEPLELLATSAVLFVLGIGLGLILVVATDDFPQGRVLVRIFFMPLYLASGVIFPIHNLPDDVIEWLSWNPVLHLMELSRGHFTPQYPVIRQANLAYPAGIALVLLAVGLAIYRLRRHQLLSR